MPLTKSCVPSPRSASSSASSVGGFSSVRSRTEARVLSRGARAARAAAWKEARLAPIGLHECRHTYAVFMIAAGVNAKALSTYMGHSSITVTLDRYGHLMPGNEREAAGMLATYLERALRPDS